jgi:hypothetical protein
MWTIFLIWLDLYIWIHMIMLGIWSTILSQVLSLGISKWGVNMSTWTWDLGLWMSSLDYFSIAVSTCTWDTSYFNMVVNTHTWDPGLWWSLLDYFNMVASTCTWDPGSWLTSTLWSTLIHGTLVYGCTSSQQALRETLF